MRRLDTMRKKFRKMKKSEDIFKMNMDIFMKPKDVNIEVIPLYDNIEGYLGIAGVVLRHLSLTPDKEGFEDSIFSSDEVFKLTPPDRAKWD